MADTWTVVWNNIAYSADPICSILNGGADVLKIRRIGFNNNNSVGGAATGPQKHTLKLYGTTAALAAPTSLTPSTHDTANGALDTVTCGYNGTPSTTGSTYDLRSWLITTGSPTGAATADIEEFHTFIPLGIVWDAGYANSEIQPLTINPDEMMVIDNAVSGGAGNQTGWIEFTNE